MPSHNKRHVWFGAFLLFLLVLGIYSWFSIAPVDMHTRIEHYILAPLLIVFAVGMLALLLWAWMYNRRPSSAIDYAAFSCWLGVFAEPA